MLAPTIRAAAPCRLLTRYNNWVRLAVRQSSFDVTLAKRLHFLSASPDGRQASFNLELHQSDCHAFPMATPSVQQVHGAVLSLAMENVTTLQLGAVDSRPAVSTEMGLSFIGVGRVGQLLRIDSRILRVGSKLGFTQAEISDQKTGKLLAVGRHSMMFVGERSENGGSESRPERRLDSVFDV